DGRATIHQLAQVPMQTPRPSSLVRPDFQAGRFLGWAANPPSAFVAAALLFLLLACSATEPQRGVLLQELTWIEAERALRPETVVVIPLGAASKEHGPHLRLENDLLLARYLQERVLAAADVVVAPTVNYSYSPTLGESPGTTPLRLETARDLVVDVCTSLARFGPR